MTSSILTLHNRYLLCFALMALLFGLAINQSIYPVALYSLILAVLFIILLSLYRFSIQLEPLHFVLLLMLSSLVFKVFAVLIFEYLMLDTVGIPFLSYKDDYVYNEAATKIVGVWNTRGFGFYRDISFSTGFYSGYPNFSALAKLAFWSEPLKLD